MKTDDWQDMFTFDKLQSEDNTRLSLAELQNNKLNEEFYLRETTLVARDLIGKILVRILPDGVVLSGAIVETEAYLSSGDAASHSATGETKRCRSMFLKGGTLYVYKIYGTHHCINVATERADIGAAVLIRAVEPITGIEQMKMFRKKKRADNLLCRGPGNLARSFDISLEQDGLSLLSDEIFIANNSNKWIEICASPRIGISKSADLPYRYFMRNSSSVSGTSAYNNKYSSII